MRSPGRYIEERDDDLLASRGARGLEQSSLEKSNARMH